METNEKTFRYSFPRIFLVSIILFIILDFLSSHFFHFSFFSFLGPQAVFTSTILSVIGIFLISLMISSTTGVIISDEDIIKKGLFGWKFLEWSEISHISIQGSSLRLQNYEGDIALVVNSQLIGFANALDLIYSKRPDLFDFEQNNEFSRSVLLSGFMVVLNILLVIFSCASLFYFGWDWILGWLLAGWGLYNLVKWFTSPQSIVLKDNTLIANLLYKTDSFPSAEISAMTIRDTETWFAPEFFNLIGLKSVEVNFRNGKSIELSAFKQGNTLIYLTLKRWHKKGS